MNTDDTVTLTLDRSDVEYLRRLCDYESKRPIIQAKRAARLAEHLARK